MGSTIILCLCGGIWLGYQYDRQITRGIINITNSVEKQIFTPTPMVTTTPKVTAVATPKKPTLNGTVLTGSKRDAMINNHLYRVGDVVNGYRITQIRYDQVTLFNPDTKKTIILTTDLS